MEKVIILNATELGYQVIKSLGEYGVRSIVLYDQERDELGRFSKYTSESFKIPGYIENPQRLLSFLMDKGKEWKGTLIIPTKDYGVEFLVNNKKTLSEYYINPTPDREIIEKIINKKILYTIAERIGVATPKFYSPKSFRDLEKIKDQIEYPCLLKPGLGHRFFRKFDFKMIEAQDYKELVDNYRNLTNNFTENEFELMICEIIPGSDKNQMFQHVSYLDQDGEVLAQMTSKKLRQDPPVYGQGRIIKSEKNYEVNEQSIKLLKELGYHGFSEIEWKFDHRDERFKLIEINPRFIFYIGLCTYCGINFPYLMYSDLVKNRKMKVNDYLNNVYWIHLYKDVLHTVLHHQMEDLKLSEYVVPYLNKKVFAVLNFKDCKPFVYQWKEHISNMFKKKMKMV